MKSSRLFTNKVIVVCAVCVVLSFLSQVFQIGVVANITYAFSLAFIVACYFCSGYSTKLMLLLAVLVFIAVARKDFELNTDYILHALIMICAFICLEVGVFVELSAKAYKFISMLFLSMSLLVLALYYLGPLRNTYFKDSGAICLNLPNPNATGLWLVCIFVLLFYCALIYKKTLKIIFFIAAFGTIPIIIATNSRNSLFACIFLVVAVVLTKIFKIKKAPRWVLVLITCLPLIVFAVYMFVIVENIEFWEGILPLENFDKGIDSRRGIWGRVIENFWSCFLVGNYPEYFDSQQHNSLLTIYCRFGAFTTGAVCVLIYRTLKNLQERSSLYAALSLGAILFTGCFEASVFTGIAGLYLMVLLVPACASVEKL